MLEIIIYLAIGAFIGWNFPQPSWARVVQARVVDFFKKSN